MSLDQPLPISVQQLIEPIPQEDDEDMAGLHIGSTTRLPSIEGRWSVWSKSDEGPGAHFLVPADDAARGLGVKYLVVRAKQPRGAAEPILTITRSDPFVKGLCD